MAPAESVRGFLCVGTTFLRLKKIFEQNLVVLHNGVADYISVRCSGNKIVLVLSFSV